MEDGNSIETIKAIARLEVKVDNTSSQINKMDKRLDVIEGKVNSNAVSVGKQWVVIAVSGLFGGGAASMVAKWFKVNTLL